MAGFMGLMDDFFGGAFGKSLSEIIKFDKTAVARSIADNTSLKKFNGLNRVANKDIKIADDFIIKKGEKVRVNNMDQLRTVLNKEGSFAPIKDKDAASKYAKEIANIKKYSSTNANISETDADFLSYIGRKEGQIGMGPWNMISGYYGDAVDGAARRGITAGAMVGASVGARVLSGGNLTTTATGERNIAGIPFF